MGLIDRKKFRLVQVLDEKNIFLQSTDDGLDFGTAEYIGFFQDVDTRETFRVPLQTSLFTTSVFPPIGSFPGESEEITMTCIRDISIRDIAHCLKFRISVWKYSLQEAKNSIIKDFSYVADGICGLTRKKIDKGVKLYEKENIEQP